MAEVVRFGVFEANRTTGELRKSGVRIRLQDQPFQILLMLLDRPGEVVTREEIQSRLWPDGTFVEFEHSIATAIKKLRQALGDDADTPRYIETLPRRGFRFIAPFEASAAAAAQVQPRGFPLPALILCAVVIGAAAISIYILRGHVPALPQRAITRLTFDSGLQFGATWSPDGRYIAYSSDRGGKFDIWVQQVGGINPVKITNRPGNNWQPDWSPDGSQIVFRSEGEGSGLFVVPALGGPERKLASFGYRPQWSPDGRLILFGNTYVSWLNKLYVVGLDGEPAREILPEFRKKERIAVGATAWYPGSNRLSIIGYAPQGWGFWTVSLDGSKVAKYDAESKVAEQLAKISNKERLRFRWGPSARNIYLDGEVNSVRNIWKISVNPSTMRFVSMERLTTGPGPDTDLAISPDGKRLAYAARAQQVRVWLYPLDSEIGRLVGEGRPITPAGVDAWEGEISRDGTKLAYTAIRSGKPELWEESLPDGPSTLLVRGESYPHGPRWSPDAKHVAFTASKGDRYQPVAMPQGGGSSEAITSGAFHGAFFDWSPDGQSFISDRVVEEKDGVTEHSVLLLPLSAAPRAETQAKVITSSRTDYIDEIRFSPNGRWLAFEGVKGGSGTAGGGANATLYVVAVAGGTWVPITDGGFWDDKPRWSADGKLIYMLSTRSGFLNLWAIRFDPEQGHPTGQPFQVTTFESPGRMIADNLDLSSMSLSSNLLALSMMETSGSIWTLDDVDK